MIEVDEIGSYKKRTESNTSKSKRKSKHKHIYDKECLVCWRKIYYHACYCGECGKIKGMVFDCEILPNGCYKMLTNAEMLEKYKDLDIIEINSLNVQYLPLEE